MHCLYFVLQLPNVIFLCCFICVSVDIFFICMCFPIACVWFFLLCTRCACVCCDCISNFFVVFVYVSMWDTAESKLIFFFSFQTSDARISELEEKLKKSLSGEEELNKMVEALKGEVERLRRVNVEVVERLVGCLLAACNF